ncbi:hypothetical protein NIASO_12700 [Niabella soli DSM 19437]|uniref:Uncharacterized protein n=1 Tax=Niabella soli DSM 19437 TaxID=929713 RepID=W0F3U1_9BACT|nr:hypothetical protein NIASO_12700 [Niabella soli DSM 19437]
MLYWSGFQAFFKCMLHRILGAVAFCNSYQQRVLRVLAKQEMDKVFCCNHEKPYKFVLL